LPPPKTSPESFSITRLYGQFTRRVPLLLSGQTSYAPAASNRTKRNTLMPASSSCLPKEVLLSITEG